MQDSLRYSLLDSNIEDRNCYKIWRGLNARLSPSKRKPRTDMKQRHTPTVYLVGGVSTMLESLSICVHTSEQSTENGEITYWPAQETTKGIKEKVQMLSKLKISWIICRLYASRCNLISFHSTPKGEKARVACMLL